MRTLPGTVAVSLGLVAVGLVGAGPASAAPSYHSPGYSGTKQIPKVAPDPFPTITLGTGRNPDVLVDAAGTGHIVFTVDGGSLAADALSYCRLPRGQKGCGVTASPQNPVAPAGGAVGPFEGNFPGGNADTAGAFAIDQGNALYLVDRRFPNVFPQPGGGTGDSNVFLWASQDGGATFDPPAMIGDNQIGGGAITYGGDDAPSIGTLSSVQTGSLTFQGVGFGQYTHAQAALGTGDQIYDGGLATDGTRPVAVFTDLAPTTYVREWTGTGNVNDPATWSTVSFPGASARIASGPGGVFVLYRDSLVGGNVFVRKLVGGELSGAPVKVGGSSMRDATIAGTANGIAIAFTGDDGVGLRTSGDGVAWSAAQLIAAEPSGEQIGQLALSATADGGGFATYVTDPVGALGVGTVKAAVFGTQQATNLPGLGQVAGGGLSSALGDQLATSTCTTAAFGDLVAQTDGSCFAHDSRQPTLDVTLGSLNLNGLSIVPDAGVRIGIDPRQHTLDTTGAVSVLLKGQGLSITLWHGELHLKLPTAEAGTDLFDFSGMEPPDVAGFPVSGHVNVKLVKGGVQVPVSLKLPGVFGGITGAAVLTATQTSGLNVDSLEFKVADAAFGALELKDVDITYQRTGTIWTGKGTINVPTGGKLISLSAAIEFADGQYRSGRVDATLPYPGIPLDATDTPPQLYLSGGGLGLGLEPLTLTGDISFGMIPLYTASNPAPANGGGKRDYAFSLDGSLKAAFGSPVTLTLTATGFLYSVQIADATLVYTLPDTVKLDGHAGLTLGPVTVDGQLHAAIDPHANVYAGRIATTLTLRLSQLGLGVPLPLPDVTIPSLDVAVNNRGFGVYVTPAAGVPFIGTVTYDWGDLVPKAFPFRDVVGRYSSGLPARLRHGASPRAVAAGAQTLTVPAGAPSLSLSVTGDGGAPAVVLTAPDGSTVVPTTTLSADATAVAIGDPTSATTNVGVRNPAAGTWTVSQADGSQIPLAGVQYAIGETPPVVKATVAGRGSRRTLRYTSTAIPSDVTVSFAEQTGSLLHVIGKATGRSGTLKFTPAAGPGGKRQIVALIDNGGLPHSRPVVARYVAPRPARPSAARGLRVSAGRTAFTVRFAPPRNATHTLLTITTTDGRHLQRVLPTGVRMLSIPVIGFRDGITVRAVGIGATGVRGPATTAKAKRRS